MNYLVESEFKLNWASLVSLLIGLVMGAVLFVLIYTLVTLKKVKNTTYTVEETIKDVSMDEVNEEIYKAQKEFLIRKEEEKGIKFPNLRDVSINLIKTVAKKFYPDSIEPIAELTLEEIVLLDHYIISKIEEILDKRGLKPLHKLKISTIIKIINAKQKVENNKVVQGVKKTGISKVIANAYAVLNVINPATWFKKLIINPSVGLITKHICLTVIRIIGQETYHVYSKQAFLEYVDDKEIEKLLKEMEQGE